MIDYDIELDDLRICEDCGCVFDYYSTKDCPTCNSHTTICQDCGGKITLKVEWGEYYISSVRYECDGCSRAGIAEVEPRG